MLNRIHVRQPRVLSTTAPLPLRAPAYAEVGGYCRAGSGDPEHSGERDDSLELPRVGARDPEGAHGAGVGGGCFVAVGVQRCTAGGAVACTVGAHHCTVGMQVGVQ